MTKIEEEEERDTIKHLIIRIIVNLFILPAIYIFVSVKDDECVWIYYSLQLSSKLNPLKEDKLESSWKHKDSSWNQSKIKDFATYLEDYSLFC